MNRRNLLQSLSLGLVVQPLGAYLPWAKKRKPDVYKFRGYVSDRYEEPANWEGGQMPDPKEPANIDFHANAKLTGEHHWKSVQVYGGADVDGGRDRTKIWLYEAMGWRGSERDDSQHGHVHDCHFRQAPRPETLVVDAVK